MDIMRRLVQEEEGQGLVEYGLIIALISVVIVGLVAGGFGTAITDLFTDVADKITGAATPPVEGE